MIFGRHLAAFFFGKEERSYLFRFLLRALACGAHLRIVFRRVRAPGWHKKSLRFLHIMLPYKHTFLHFVLTVLHGKIETIKGGGSNNIKHSIVYDAGMPNSGNAAFFE